MSDKLLHVYHRLPTPAQWAAATAMGVYLRRWRYGKETEALVAATLERDHWTPEQWRQYQQERLAFVLHRAATQVPFYREHWSRRRQAGDTRSWEYLEHWPILEKESVRENPKAFLADDVDIRRMYPEHTSGTTGKPLKLWWSRKTVREWYALNEARSRRWYGISRKDRWAIIGGRVVTPASRRTPPFWIWNSALRQLYMSSYHLAPDLVPAYLDALRRYDVTYVFGYSSSLHALADTALRLGRKDVRLAVAITNAEPLLDHQRHTIEAAFRCPVRETYGLAEIVAGASECEHGRLHLWPEVGLVEALDGDRTVPPGAVGDMISTSLLNADMPLIRYRTGDAVRLSSHECRCRRHLPGVDALEGRCDDLVVMQDGRRVGRLDPVFKHGLAVAEAQIVQETFTRFRVKYVPARAAGLGLEEELRHRLRDYLGSVDVVCERVDQVPRTAHGKFRAVVSHLSRTNRQPAAS
ncbi:MAG: phenylacetate--CoA ligase family protein [Acidobacteria bacterium]|nr:phenylacetate--CoA ligase family protein [Acidobacteriota bacterium]